MVFVPFARNQKLHSIEESPDFWLLTIIIQQKKLEVFFAFIAMSQLGTYKIALNFFLPQLNILTRSSKLWLRIFIRNRG